MERNISGSRAPKSKAEPWQLSSILTLLFSNPVIKESHLKSRFHQRAPSIPATSDWCLCLAAPSLTQAGFSKDLKTALSLFVFFIKQHPRIASIAYCLIHTRKMKRTTSLQRQSGDRLLGMNI